MSLDDILPHREQFASDGEASRNKHSSDNNSYGAFILKDGSYAKVGAWVCHGWLSDYNLANHIKPKASVNKVGIKYVLSHVMKPHVSDKLLRRFIDWLVNRSPWAHLHLDKDVDSILKYGYVVDADHSSAFITSGFIASRFVTESYTSKNEVEDRCKVWAELLDMGCSENEAFFFAHMYTSDGVKGSVYPITFARWSSGHSTFFANNYQENYVRAFLQGTPVNLGKAVLSVPKGYENYTLNKVWGEQTGKDSFGERVQRLVPTSKNEKQDLHIFRKAPSKGYSYKDREDFMSIIEQLRGIINA
jgi:hypothetical protein